VVVVGTVVVVGVVVVSEEVVVVVVVVWVGSVLVGGGVGVAGGGVAGTGGQRICFSAKLRFASACAVSVSSGRNVAGVLAPISPAEVTAAISADAQERTGCEPACEDADAVPARTSATTRIAAAARRPTRPQIDQEFARL